MTSTPDDAEPRLARSRDADVIVYIICGTAMGYILHRMGDPAQWTGAVAARLGTALVAVAVALIALRARRVPPADRPFHHMTSFTVGAAISFAASELYRVAVFLYSEQTGTTRIFAAGGAYLFAALTAAAIVAGVIAMATGIVRTLPGMAK